MDRIKLEGIRLFGYHGCLDEESLIGTNYNVEITVWGNLGKSAISDELKDTIDYVAINKIVAEEMAIRSKLIEQVAERILSRLMREIKMIKKSKIKLSKLQAPLNGDVDAVSIIMKKKR